MGWGRMGSGRPSLWTRLRWRAEQGFVLIGVTLLRALPYEAGEALMRLAGRGFFWISGSRRRIALENLRLAFGAEKSEEERRRIAIGSFEHAFLLLYEVLVRHRIVPDLASFRSR